MVLERARFDWIKSHTTTTAIQHRRNPSKNWAPHFNAHVKPLTIHDKGKNTVAYFWVPCCKVLLPCDLVQEWYYLLHQSVLEAGTKDDRATCNISTVMHRGFIIVFRKATTSFHRLAKLF